MIRSVDASFAANGTTTRVHAQEPPFLATSVWSGATRGNDGVQSVQRAVGGAMVHAIYNSNIPRISSKSVNHRWRLFFCLILLGFMFAARIVTFAQGSDWNGAEQALAKKIAAVTGPGAVAVNFQNRSSLSKRDSDIIQNGLRSALEAAGVRSVNLDQSAATVTISLSENSESYVWVAEIRQSAGDSSVVMVSTPRPEGALAPRDSVPLTLRKILLWTQNSPILDVAVLEENQSTSHIAVLDSERVSFYRLQGGKWQQEQTPEIAHNRPWPRDLRGRLVLARDHLLDIYLPGVFCSTSAVSPMTLNCRDSDDPWPLLAGTVNGGTLSVFPSAGLSNGASTLIPQTRAFFAPNRNFFTGAITPGIGKFATLPKFYSTAILPRERYILWLLAATDGSIHLIDGMNDQAAKLGWGSDLASVRTPCGAGWQVLATNAGNQSDQFVRAYELPDRDPLAVSTPMEVPGTITALWTEARGDTAVLISRNRETGVYEAFRVAVACNQ